MHLFLYICIFPPNTFSPQLVELIDRKPTDGKAMCLWRCFENRKVQARQHKSRCPYYGLWVLNLKMGNPVCSQNWQFCFYFIWFCELVLLCRSGFLGAHYVDQAGLKLKSLLPQPHKVFTPQVYITMLNKSEKMFITDMTLHLTTYDITAKTQVHLNNNNEL